MITRTEILKQLPNVLEATHFDHLGERYEGKVRDSYTRGEQRVLITTDRLSCFDRVVTTIPFKGQVLNQLALKWFARTQDIVQNHLIDTPHPNVMVVKNCRILPIEVVVRGYLAGSAWRDYSAGRDISGVKLPPGMRSAQRLETPLLTPATKAEHGAHDTPISESEIITKGIVDRDIWAEVREAALSLFALGQRAVAERGLILVDTKYEFGIYQGGLVLADEIHTLDSSRFWKAGTYNERFARGESPEMLDKEPTRQWLLQQGFQGDGAIPHFSDEHRVQIAEHYIGSYEQILGEEFVAAGGAVGLSIERALSGLR